MMARLMKSNWDGDRIIPDSAVLLGTVRTFDPGVALFHEGDPGTVLFLIDAGHVKVLRTGSDGQETLLHVYGPGECLAEMALVDGRPRSASAVAVDQVKARVIYRDHFLTLLQRSPAIALALMSRLSEIIRRLDEQVQDLIRLDVPQRLAKALLQLSDQHGQATPRGCRNV